MGFRVGCGLKGGGGGGSVVRCMGSHRGGSG